MADHIFQVHQADVALKVEKGYAYLRVQGGGLVYHYRFLALEWQEVIAKPGYTPIWDMPTVLPAGYRPGGSVEVMEGDDAEES